MKSRKFGCSSLIFLIVLGLIFQPHSEVPVNSQSPDYQPTQVEEKIITNSQGIEKLSPDLRSIVQNQPNLPPELALGGINPSPLIISVLLQPGVNVKPYFIRSATSRVVGNYQWAVGEIMPEGLLKLASLPGTLSIFSTNTFQTTEAPGLEMVQERPPYINIADAKVILKQGGPDLLIERMQQAQERSPSRQPADQNLAGAALVEDPAPSIVDVHDIQRAYDAGFQGQGVIVAVVDTGVDFAHPDLQGTQAVISQGPFQGWPFAYDTLSGARYAMDSQSTLNPENIWAQLGETQYARALPIGNKNCVQSSCSAELLIGQGSSTGNMVAVSWPNTSKSGNYLYSVHPDILLMFAAYYLDINYPIGWTPPIVIVSDEAQSGVYDTVYTDINFNHRLGDSGEKMTKGQPLGGVDLTGDGMWDLSGGMLAWISDGQNHPPGVSTLYPEMLSGVEVPGPGQLLAFINDQHGHGTNCASEIAGQGIISDPYGIGPINPLYAGGVQIGGTGTPVIQGIAPGAKIAAFQNGFNLPFDSWTLASLGMDGIVNNGDEAQIVSNSWGDSRIIADGWDSVSRFAQTLSYEVDPSVSFLAATGNGGHGYGTETSPGGASILDIGASTAYGPLRVFENVTQQQFLYGEVQPWSNRGPGGLGDFAPDLVAVGAWGTGAQPLNYYYGDGQTAYDVFGGTSMSTPVAAASMALVYQAFRAQPQNQRWPNWDEARAILLNSAQNLGYDVFVQGAGNIQAGRAIDIITDQAPWVEPQQWQAGDYYDRKYPAFPKVLLPGDSDQQEFTIHNPTDQEILVQVEQRYLRKQHEETFTLSFSPPYPDSGYAIPVHLEDLTNLVNSYNPALIRAHITFPYDTFDVNQNYFADNWWSVYFYDWTDHNQDGNLWVDENRNSLVEEEEIDISSETDIYEYNRFTYAYPQSTYVEASLGSQGIEQMHDGIYLGVDCNYCGDSITLQVQVTFYEYSDWDWLSLDQTSLAILPQEQSVFVASLAVPADAAPGSYDSAIELKTDTGGILIPLVAHIAAGSHTFEIGDPTNQDTPFENGMLFGGFNWNWRYESGDWRSFYFDIPEGSSQPGRSLLVETEWSVPKTDIDTWVIGPSTKLNPDTDPDTFGPQTLEVISGSEDANLMEGTFAWKTNTGTTRELVGAPLTDGLGMISLHNVLTGGGQLNESFRGSVFQFASQPGEAFLDVIPESAQQPYLSGSQTLSFTSTGDIPEGIQVRAYGFSTPIQLKDQMVYQDSRNSFCSATWVYAMNQGGLNINHSGILEISSRASAANLDLDVYLFEDNGDEIWNCNQEELRAYSINSNADEHIKILFPQDGKYWVAVHGYTVPQGIQNFDLDIRVIQGTEIQLRNIPSGPITANVPAAIQLNFQSLYTAETPTTFEGLLLVGPPSVPTLLEIPIQLRPSILIYPEPILKSKQRWVQQTPQLFSLSFQNQGVEAETVQVSIAIPEELVYTDGTAVAPGTDPEYHPDTHELTWQGEAGAEQHITITFQAAAIAGISPKDVTLSAHLTGLLSSQTWQVDTTVEINRYGFLFPLIRR